MKQVLLTVMALGVFVFPAAAVNAFSASATLFSNPNFCPTGNPGGNGSPTPVFAFSKCDDGLGFGEASAQSNFGHVGVDFSDTDNSGGIPRFLGNVSAQFDTDIVFTGPGATVLVNGMNLDISGTLTAFGGRNSSVGLTFNVLLGGVGWGANMNLVGDGTFTCTSLGNFICPTAGVGAPVGLLGRYQTQDVLVQTNVPVHLTFQLIGGGGSFDPGGFVQVDYSHSLDFAPGGSLFNLPTGFTANDPDMFIVDNQFQLPGGVPEPATWWLAGFAIALMVWMRRRASLGL
jgi:hypothetical protein